MTNLGEVNFIITYLEKINCQIKTRELKSNLTAITEQRKLLQSELDFVQKYFDDVKKETNLNI